MLIFDKRGFQLFVLIAHKRSGGRDSRFRPTQYLYRWQEGSL